MVIRILLAVVWLALPVAAIAAQADSQVQVEDNIYGVLPSSQLLVTPTGGTQQKLGDALVNSSGSSVIPTGAPTALPLPTVASQQGVLLDAFKVAGDPDDTAAMTRAVAAGMPILLGPKTYTINNFNSGAGAPNFTLIGVRGKSVIQRTSASGSNFFTVASAVVSIDGVTFDSNKAVVTANQWGVLFSAGGQAITISNSVFKNNSGSLGSCLALLSTGPGAGGSFKLSKNEITGCTFNPLYLASVSNGDVEGNYIHDNTTTGMYVLANGSASSTNYSTNINIRGNRFITNSGSGLSMGSFAPPYAYANPAATYVLVEDNLFQDNSGYQLGFVNTQHTNAIGNHLVQSASGVATAGGIDCNAQYFLIEGNDLSFPSAGYGIDCGGAVEATVRNNNVSMGARGAAIDIGGAVNSQALNNHVNVSGTASGVVIYDLETDGSLNPFPFHTSNVAVSNNDIILNGASTFGVQVLDNAGATSGALPVTITGNRFVGQSSAVSAQDISYFTAGTGITVQGNTHNGSSGVSVVLNGSTDYVFDTVYDLIQGDSTAGSVRGIVNGYVNTYNGGTKILWVNVTAGGSGYTAATVLTPSGGCTWTGSALISSGVIVGVRTNSNGASCSSGTTITASDTGGGTGATFTVSVTPTLPARKAIQYRTAATNGNVVQTGGGAIGIGGAPGPMFVIGGPYLALTANGGGTQWQLTSDIPQPVVAIGNLPTCTSSYNGATVNITGSTTSKWQARCNGTNWLWPDGTTVSS